MKGRLAELRAISGHSAAWCASTIGHVSKRTWLYWEAGRNGQLPNPPADVIAGMETLANAVQTALKKINEESKMGHTEWHDDFAAAFIKNAPAGFDADADARSEKPWQKPWLWADADEWQHDADDAENSARIWAEKVCEQFSAGFIENAPQEYLVEDRESGAPWCAPWTWDKYGWYKPGFSPHALGAIYAGECYTILQGLYAKK